ncbi:L-type lectin-domain containing receptor kinase IX.1 [Raphanus sativus]|nr:L-type lectin-domain containing receptor kinase IX.1 [Raphanus sativus]
MANTIFFFFSFVLFLPFVSTIHFNIPRFGSHITEVVYQGDARANGAVELTNIDYTCRTGWATYSKKIPLWDPEIGQPSDFTTSFSFRIDTHGVAFGNYGHGFAFFLAPLGIEMLPTRPNWDPLDMTSHVGINNNSFVSSSVTSWNASSHNRDICRVVIVYDSDRRNLSVSWMYTSSDPKENSSLSYIIDLSKVLPSEVIVGFSATSGERSLYN